MRGVLARRLVVAVAAVAVTISAAFGAFVVLPVNDLVDRGHAAAVADRADLTTALARGGVAPTGDAVILAAPSAAGSAGDSPVDWLHVDDPTWRRDVHRGRLAQSVRALGDGRLLVISDERDGAIERRERVGLVAALLVVLAATMGWALWAGGLHARRLGRVAMTARRIADGDLGARSALSGADEVARLGADVDRMAVRLDALEKARAEFVARISHDLRTPLTVIKGYAYTLARRAQPDDPSLRRLAAISRETDRLAALVDDLLTLSQARAGGLRIAREPFAAADLLAEILERVGPLAAERGVRTVAAETEVVIDGDRRRLAQVLTNLAVNAVKATPTGGTVTLGADLDDAGEVVLAVDDDGPGIDADQLPRLLRPFASGQAAGTGLGLAIVTELVALHDGSLALDPRPLGGTRARVTLRHAVAVPAARP